jgi:hypothetical protein
MFTWVCPNCGREVPPSASECPDCAEQSSRTPAERRAAAAGQRPDPAAPLPGGYVRGAGLPLWLLTILFAAGFGALGVGAFVAYRHFTGGGDLSLDSTRAEVARAAGAAASGTLSPEVLLKFLEVTGIRLIEEDAAKTGVAFLVVNHSRAPLTDLAGTVTLRPSTAKPGKEIVGIFGFEHLSLGPFESREMRAPLKTTLRPYELPDWQFLRAELSIASPPAAR